MANSVNTNGGALVALSSLRANTATLDRTSKQVQTGLRIADQNDDAAIFAIAQGVRANVKAYASVQSSLSAGIGLGEVALAGANRIYDLVSDIQGKIANLADGSLSTAQQNVYRNDIVRLIDSINQIVQQADYNGKNLLSGDAQASTATITFVADVNGTTLNYSTPYRLDWDSDAFLGPNVLFPGTTDVYENIFENPPDTATALVGLNAFKSRLDSMASTVAAQKRALEQQKDFVDNLVDAMKGGLGSLVDADVAAESAALESGKVAQQLSIQSLSIANQQPNVLLTLLR
ncbi:flagellin [Ferrovibrio sp.]|uniref:flagellin n=1 Tax=Ferrovibrio sp. TaxID=1917215 RepID=UPI00311DEDC8